MSGTTITKLPIQILKYTGWILMFLRRHLNNVCIYIYMANLNTGVDESRYGGPSMW